MLLAGIHLLHAGEIDLRRIIGECRSKTGGVCRFKMLPRRQKIAFVVVLDGDEVMVVGTEGRKDFGRLGSNNCRCRDRLIIGGGHLDASDRGGFLNAGQFRHGDEFIRLGLQSRVSKAIASDRLKGFYRLGCATGTAGNLAAVVFGLSSLPLT
jgi:hypothetical protein